MITTATAAAAAAAAAATKTTTTTTMHLFIFIGEQEENMGNLSKVRDHQLEPDTSQTKQKCQPLHRDVRPC
jgi:hypothetical protein